MDLTGSSPLECVEKAPVKERAVITEVEAKLLIEQEHDLRAIGRLTELGPFLIRVRDRVRLYSIYVDTPELTLARRGIAVRVRRQAGRWEATVKWAGRTRGAVHERPELTVPLARAPRIPWVLPDSELRAQLGPLLPRRPLNPIVITDIRRRRFDVFPKNPSDPTRPVAELALDRVHLYAPATGKPQMTYFEVEIELLHGRRRNITTLAQLLRRRFRLTPSADSKFAHGLKLIYGARPFANTTQRTPTLSLVTAKPALYVGT